ncbi:MAG: hypothetical protein ACE5GM_01770 [bacterium]
MAVFLFIVIGVIIGSVWVTAKQEPLRSEARFDLKLINSLEAPAEREKFDCRDKVYAQIKWYDLPAGPHSLEARWFNPDRRLQETTKDDFTSLGRKISYTRVWLKMLPRTENELTGPDDEFAWAVGDWRVEIYLDGRLLSKKSFQVDC